MENTQLDHEQVKKILPHRAPMLFVDEVTKLIPGELVEAFLVIDPAKEIFKGHFPGSPILPGVCSIEAMAQGTDVLLMTLPDYAGKLPLLIGVDKARFYKKIVPGDTAYICTRMHDHRRDKALATCKCSVHVDKALAAEAEITIAMR